METGDEYCTTYNRLKEIRRIETASSSLGLALSIVLPTQVRLLPSTAAFCLLFSRFTTAIFGL